MKFFAVLLPLLDQKKSDEARPAHLEFLNDMKDSGHVSAFGRFTDGSGGLVIFNADSYEDCEALVKRDPYVETGARSYEIREWGVLWADLKTEG